MSNHEDIERLEGKMEKLVDGILGKKDGLVKVAHPNASMSNNSYKQYRSSFLTMGDLQIPDDYRDIFKWCRYFFKFDSLVGPAVRAMATFPVTSYVVNDSQAAEEDETLDDDDYSESYQFYSGMLKEITLNKHLIEIGYDYHLYGNCIIFAEPGTKNVKRRNPETQEIVEEKQVVWKNIQRLDVTRVRIDKDPNTQEKTYYYEIPPDIKAIIQSGKPKAKFDKIPAIFKEAVKKKGIVRLNSKYIFHFSMPSESGDNGLWATPPVLHAMKLLLYTNVLRQAQEAIAYEHIIPKRVYFFQETNSLDPSYDFGRVAEDFAFELKKQLNDPNYQVISPIPVNQIQQGGQGKNLLLVPEIEQNQNTILAAMGCPREFVFGGVSYSGSTTSLRIVENNFLTYRTLLEEYINEFLIKGLAKIRGEWEVPEDDEKLITVSLSDLKMQDDIQQKELMIRLNQAGKVPDEVLLEKVLGLDASTVQEQLQTERERMVREQMEMQFIQQKVQQELEEKYGTAMPGQQMPEDPNAAGGQGQVPQQQEQEGMAPAAQPEAAQDPQAQGGQPSDVSNAEASSIAQQLLSMPEEEVDAFFAKIPVAARQRIESYYLQLKDQQETNDVDMRPMPEKLPPRREGGV